MHRGTVTGGHRKAVPVRRARRLRRRAAALGGLVTLHVVAFGAAPMLLAPRDGEVADATPAPTAGVSPEAGSAPLDVRAAQLPVAEAPMISPDVPQAPELPLRGTGTFATAPASARVPSGATTYRVEVERGLPYAAPAFARAVDRTLHDPRSWGALAGTPLARVDGDADFRIVLASEATTADLCAPLTTRKDRVSCRNHDDVVINVWRWATGSDSYAGDLASYRNYVVNHEVGHALGHGHVGCGGVGEQAPVMLQQTLGLDGCAPNPWPLRREAK